jgi:hypothetical protein
MVCDLKNYHIKKCNDELYEILLSACNINEENMTFLLNNKFDNIVEKTVYDIASFHLKKMDKEINETTFIEFWFKANGIPSKSLHIDCDEYERQINKSQEFATPILSCITYLNDNIYIPTIITDIDKEKYKFKDFNCNESVLYFSFPKKWKHITFNGGKYYHGACQLYDIDEKTERNIFLINIWNKKPLNVPYFNAEHFFFKYAMLYKKEIPTISYLPKIELIIEESNNENIYVTDDNLLTEDFYEKILYNNDYSNDIFEKIKSKIKCNIQNDIIILSNSKKIDKTKEGINIDERKFCQRFLIQNHFTKDICKWIINEYEEYALLNGGWTKDRHKKYPTTDLQAESCKNVFRFIITTFIETISKIILDSYQLKNNDDDDFDFDFNDIFVVKYESGQQEFLEMHTDNSMITVNILLSEPNIDFVGGGTFFDDELTVNAKIGDMLIHCGKDRHSGLPITSGKRYLLVYFINIFKK